MKRSTICSVTFVKSSLKDEMHFTCQKMHSTVKASWAGILLAQTEVNSPICEQASGILHPCCFKLFVFNGKLPLINPENLSSLPLNRIAVAEVSQISGFF